MRLLPLVILAFTGVALCADAVAQDRGPVAPSPPAAAATTGAAPRGPAAPAPPGHRQPTAATVQGPPAGDAVVSPYDQEIDRSLNICRGC